MRITKDDCTIQGFSFSGGLLEWLGNRLSLVRNGTDTWRLGVALALLTWGVLMLLAFLQGLGHKVLSPGTIGVHVRLLVAIPLFFACETLVAPRMAEFIRNITRAGVVPEAELPALNGSIRRVRRMMGSVLPEVLLLLVVFALPLIQAVAHLPIRTGNWAPILDQAGGRLVWAHSWYLGFCLPLFQFLMLRWLWRLGLWWYFLWRVSRLRLNLVAIHSDGAGGLGYLEIVHEHFIPLVLAISAVLSADFSEALFSQTMVFDALYRLALIALLLTVVLFIVPLLVFFRRLWVCRRTAMSEYMIMAARYVNAFDRKWVRDEQASGESQLGTPDLQSLADLTNSVNVASRMRIIPVSRRLVVELAVSVILPFTPLIFVKYNLDELAVRLFGMLSGR